MQYKSKSLSIVLHAEDDGHLLHVLAVGHAGLAAVLEARLHDGEGLMGRRWPPRGCWNRNKGLYSQRASAIKSELALQITHTLGMATIVSTFW